MILFEIVFVILMVLLGVIVTISDYKLGIIKNKILIRFAVLSLMLDIIYYGFFAQMYVDEFLLNYIVISLVSLFLFYSHSLAGGDCKLIMVFALMYPARWLISYNNNFITLFAVIGISILMGYGYLIIDSIVNLINKKNKFDIDYTKKYILNFCSSFVATLIYISILNMVLYWINVRFVSINVWIIRIACFLFAWIVSKNPILKKWYVVIPIITLGMLLCLYLGVLPISLNIEHYIMVFSLLLCQLLIRTGLYEEVDITLLEKNMILATASSVIMQGTKMKNMPRISCEDLRDRLTEDEVEAVKRWGKSRKVQKIMIVKKIPFALFVFLGFIVYMILWRVFR